MDLKNIFTIGLAVSCLLLFTVACEKAGKEVDRDFDSAPKKLSDATK